MAKKSKFYLILLESVAGGDSLKVAAIAAGCSYDHAARIARQEDFRLAVSEHRTQILDESLGRLSNACRQAVETLRELLDSDDAAIRVKAASAILDRFLKLHEAVEVRQRLEALELAAKGRSILIDTVPGIR